MKALRILLAGAAMALAVPQIAIAQAPVPATLPELTQSFLYKGMWGFRVPAGWQWNSELSFPYLANGPEAAATMERGAPLPPGGIAIGIFPQDLLSALGLIYTPSVEELAASLAAWLGGDINLMPLEGTAEPALTTSLSGSAAVPPNSQLVVYQAGGAAFAMVVITADFAAAADTIRAMIASTVVLGPIP
ncbi:MAG: hypothetical protein KIS68_12300 [Bauldia sp.]|nr:hypothetical protein [Bauldia sp.]